MMSTAEPSKLEQELRAMNEALLISSVKQHELTEQAQQAESALRESEERFRAIADNIPQLAWMADRAGRISWFNQRWLDYTGKTLAENQKSGWMAALHPAHVEAVANKFQLHLDEGRDWEDTFPMRGKDGQYRWFLSRMNAIRDDSGKLVRFFGTNTDVTEQREIAEVLRINAGVLADAARNKDEFLATLAHELRNPLAPIRNAVQYLGMEGLAESDVRAGRDIIARQVTVMVRLIDDLLDMSRISRNTLDIRKQLLDLATVVESAVESSRPLIVQSNHELTVSLSPQPLHVDADPIRLAQAFLNLLNNAAKYTPNGGHIWLTTSREGSDAVISVRDNGLGIPAAMLGQIFDMFTQVDRKSVHSQGGLGIGLTLVRRLIEMHDGSIEVRSPGSGQGSEFIVRLPLPFQPRPELAPKFDGQRVQALSNCRILVVDDNRDSAQTLGMLLHIKGNVIQTAYDGQQAVEVAETFRPELIMLDIGLPKLNGYEVARRIRQQPWGQEVMLVAMTGWGQDEDRRHSHEAGFNFHLVKPVELAALEKLLARPVGTSE